MRYGRTAIVNFLSQLGMSLSGFVSTIVLTRTLGQSRYGTYVVVLSLLSWTAIFGKLGIPQAVRKRVSEDSGENFVVSGTVAQIALYVIVVIFLWMGRGYVNSFMKIEAVSLLTVMLGARLGLDLVRAILDGQHLVHVSSILSPVELTSRSVVQVVLVLSGAGIFGALTGYVVGAVIAAILGIYFITVPENRPTRSEFAQLQSYAKFSWLGSIKGRMFLSMDTIILAVFVSHSLVAVYEVAWNLASLFAIFGGSIAKTLFPEISKISSNGDSDGEVAELLRISLAYSGLFIIPGLVGAALVGDVVLTIYGSSFQTGYYVLLILSFALLLYSYMDQFVSTIDALDYPDLTFYINTIFVLVNMTLNVVLTWQYGWYGAATATTTSAGIGLVLGYHFASHVVDVTVPFDEIAKQWFSAGIMAIVVILGRIAFGDGPVSIFILIGVGVIVYFAVLLFLSEEFRTSVEENLPIHLPIFDGR